MEILYKYSVTEMFLWHNNQPKNSQGSDKWHEYNWSSDYSLLLHCYVTVLHDQSGCRMSSGIHKNFSKRALQCNKMFNVIHLPVLVVSVLEFFS